MHFYYVSIRIWIQLGESFQSTNRGLSSKQSLQYEDTGELKDRYGARDFCHISSDVIYILAKNAESKMW